MKNQILITLVILIAAQKATHTYPKFTTYNECYSYDTNSHYGIGKEAIGWPECHKLGYGEQNKNVDKKYNGYCTLNKPIGKYYEYEDQVTYTNEEARGICEYETKTAIRGNDYHRILEKQDNSHQQIHDSYVCKDGEGNVVKSDNKCYAQSYTKPHGRILHQQNSYGQQKNSYGHQIKKNNNNYQSQGHRSYEKDKKVRHSQLHAAYYEAPVKYIRKQPIKIQYRIDKVQGYCLYQKKVPVHSKLKVERTKFEQQRGYCEYIEKLYIAPPVYVAPPKKYVAPPKKYVAPPKKYVAPPKKYEAPKQNHEAPKQHHKAPKQHHKAPKQHHKAPKQHHVPVQQQGYLNHYKYSEDTNEKYQSGYSVGQQNAKIDQKVHQKSKINNGYSNNNHY